MTWLNDLVNQHKELESPTPFWYWAGLCTISAVVKDNLYIDRFAYKLYPNIYVMLHADSGLKKGPPVGLAKRLVKTVNNTKIISGRSSIQGILKELATAESRPGGKIDSKSTAFIVASEFSSSLVSDPAAMTILTDLYDRQYNEDDYKSLLKMDSFTLKSPTISLLVATNEAHFDDFIAAKDMKGGFVARMFIIAEDKAPHLNALGAPLETTYNEVESVKYLKAIAALKGKFQDFGAREQSDIHSIPGEQVGRKVFFSQTGQLYNNWYLDFYDTIKKQGIKDATGTIQRFGDSVLKVAMLISLSENLELIITPSQLQEAITICETLIGSIRKTTHGKKGMSSHAQHKALIIHEIMTVDSHRMKRADMLHKFWMHFNAPELDEIMQSFHESGLILIRPEANEVYYEMPPVQYVKMRKFLEGKSD